MKIKDNINYSGLADVETLAKRAWDELKPNVSTKNLLDWLTEHAISAKPSLAKKIRRQISINRYEQISALITQLNEPNFLNLTHKNITEFAQSQNIKLTRPERYRVFAAVHKKTKRNNHCLAIRDIHFSILERMSNSTHLSLGVCIEIMINMLLVLKNQSIDIKTLIQEASYIDEKTLNSSCLFNNENLRNDE